MKRVLPYFFISVAFLGLLVVKFPSIFSYKFSQDTVKNYLKSQDIEDPKGFITDRVIMSDSDTYSVAGYLYAKGEDPTKYNFQHPPLIKYLFGFSILLVGNPFYVQIIFGLMLLFLTYLLGTKILKNRLLALVPVLLLLIDPLFGSQMTETLLDPGQAVFALGYITLMLLYPESYILQGLVLGLFVASKFWSTVIIFVFLIYTYKIFLLKEKINYKKIVISLLLAFFVFSVTYLKTFIVRGAGFIPHQAGGAGFNIFLLLAKEMKYMLAHDSAGAFGGTILLFFRGYILWPVSLLAGIYLMLKTKVKDVWFFLLMLPIVYLFSLSTALPFTRYFLIILPFLYINIIHFYEFFVDKGPPCTSGGGGSGGGAG